jgi:hypothetical protein
MPLGTVFERFADLLDHRLSRGILTTEDSVRYTFFYALTETLKLHPTEVVLEHPHPVLPGSKKIDVLISAAPQRPTIALEFKYDRNNSDHNKARTKQAAAVVTDVFRLARMPASVAALKYLVYLTDPEMESHFLSPKNRLSELIDAGAQGHRLTPGIFSGHSKTFREGLGEFETECRITGVLSKRLAADHSLRVFGIT